jgi:hypothetical protein
MREWIKANSALFNSISCAAKYRNLAFVSATALQKKVFRRRSNLPLACIHHPGAQCPCPGSKGLLMPSLHNQSKLQARTSTPVIALAQPPSLAALGVSISLDIPIDILTSNWAWGAAELMP